MEPDDYQLLRPDWLRTVTLGDRTYEFGFCVNSPDGAGYNDDKMLWIADQITDPARVIEVIIHECLHGAFRLLPEGKVDLLGRQISGLICDVFKAKGAGPLPQLAPMGTADVLNELFPDGPIRKSAK